MSAIVLGNGRAIFQRREKTKAVPKLGNEIRNGNEEALTADVTTGKVRMLGLARESRMTPGWRSCNVYTETGLRKKIG